MWQQLQSAHTRRVYHYQQLIYKQTQPPARASRREIASQQTPLRLVLLRKDDPHVGHSSLFNLRRSFLRITLPSLNGVEV
jgi:hypothetical protein